MKALKLSVFLGLLMVLILPFPLRAMSEAVETKEVYHPQIRKTSGPVTVKGVKYAIWEPAAEGMLLLAGDVLKTEKDGYAVIEFASGTVEIFETTVVVIPSVGSYDRKKDIREVFVEEGNTFFDINHLGVEKGFEFRTRNVQGGVKGTMFTVGYREGRTSVGVYRGVVQVSDLEGSVETMVDLNAGDSLSVVEKEDFKDIEQFDPDEALENYSYNVPPGLDGSDVPSDFNANPDNNGVRDRGAGEGRDKDDKDKD
jgi:hypothetical protein